ncbi:MAG: PEP-CTERM sorting domain-containing protein [Planctomycetota bacterium]
MKPITTAALITAGLAVSTASAQVVDLGGQATGYFGITGIKASSTQDGIEGLNPDGTFNPNHNGLPEYPNYQRDDPNQTFASIIATPLSAGSDYSELLNVAGNALNGSVNNQTITDVDFSSASVGVIEYDAGSLNGVGTETIGVADLTFDFNTFLWDGNITPSLNGDSRSDFDAPYASPEEPVAISPFSPAITPYNDGGGAGNAQINYAVSLSNAAGTGLTFVDGQLTSMDITGDMTFDVLFVPVGAVLTSFDGTFTASGLSYELSASGSSVSPPFNPAFFVNRAGTIPEPASLGLLSVAGLALVRRRR